MALVLGLLVVGGCRGTVPVPREAVLEPLGAPATTAPTAADRAAAELAAAALASGPAAVEEARAALTRAVARDQESGFALRYAPEALEALADDAAHATLDDPRAYRKASRELLRRGGLHPAHRARLEQAVHDDPLRLANARVWDHRERLFARTFNAVSEPLGQSLFGGFVVAPFKLAGAAMEWALRWFEDDPLDLQQRQALALRKEFLERHPDAPEAEEIARRVEKAEAKLRDTRRRDWMSRAGRALDQDRPRLASALAGRVLAQEPEDEQAHALADVARARAAETRALRRRSLAASDARPSPWITAARSEAAGADPSWGPGAALAERLLAPEPLSVSEARALRDRYAHTALEDEAEYVLALAQHEEGAESAGWRRLAELARRDPRSSNMSRHAAALFSNPWQNAYASFREERRRGRRRALRYALFSGWAIGPRYERLPPTVAYLVDSPRIARTVLTTPLRLLTSRFQPPPEDFDRPAALAAYRYLDRHPGGEHARELIEWLYAYEEEREHWAAALRLADLRPGFDPERRAELVEEVARGRIERAEEIERLDMRGSVLRQVVREFPDSTAGHAAGMRVRQQALDASPQEIRLTRGFLLENPRVAGPQGLGLRAGLLDGALHNGELHPMGVSFRGARVIEVALLGESGDEEEPPVLVRRRVSAERLARLVAVLDESVLLNERLDPDERLEADAQRDLFFERARLEVAEEPDRRATARSTYVFQGARERYGMVRGRESALPFDLVFQGSLTDLTLGAFPRWRTPKETPDAFLYR